MTDGDRALDLLDHLLELARGSAIAEIEVEHDGTTVSLLRTPLPAVPAARAVAAEATSAPAAHTVQAPTVGIFSAVREWAVGDAVQRGAPLGAVQSLGHMAEISAPSEGVIAEVLVTGGSPVEYGQALFVIAAA
ncbi:MAG: acetyl-CoA carboxylase biotin carboxyl carrier protein subunit [Candidatus Limnocylindria bacterium]